MSLHYLSALFSPQSIAIFGAEEGSEALGSFVFRNLLDAGFSGSIYPINPNADKVHGYPAYQSLTQVDQLIDLAVIATPVETVVELVRQCGEQGVKMLLILPAGFREAGPVGRLREQQVMALVRHYGMRLMGPNCLGFIRPVSRLNLTFGNSQVAQGNLALVSQSGSICAAVLDWAELNEIGFSTVISTGTNADLDFGDYLDYLAQDGATKSILLYVEGISNSRRFMSALRAAALVKPVIVLKVGRHSSAARASFSHTGSMIGSDEVFGAALDRAGVLRVRTVSELISASRVLATTRFSTRGERVAIITNGGGPGVMATDCAADRNVELAKLSVDTLARLNAVLPAFWSQSNPIDLAGDAPPERYHQALKICLDAPEIDAAIVILTPQAMTRPTDVARSVADLARASTKPVLVTWMGGTQVLEARRLFNKAGVPQFNTLENCIEGYSYKVAFQRTQRLLLQVPGKLKRGFKVPDRETAQRLIDGVLAEGRSVLDEQESFQVLRAFHIPTAQSIVARDADEACAAAESIGYPVVMKILSSQLSHKSDVGGVRLNLNSAEQVRDAHRELFAQIREQAPQVSTDRVSIEKMYRKQSTREVMAGLKRDPVFGPVISFGSGGTYVEALGDVQVALPPLNRKLARDLICRSRISKLLDSYRNLPAVNFETLEYVLLRLSNLACELPSVVELDINPLMIDETGVVAVDARIRVVEVKDQKRPYDHLAIHPYPVNLIKYARLKNGEPIVIRPVRPEDAELTQNFVSNLSDEARYFRFMSALQELTPRMLVRFTQIDYQDEMALIAVRAAQSESEQEDELGVARYSTTPDHQSCEFAIAIATAWEGQGLAYKLMTQLIEIARERGLKTMYGEILATNRRMLNFMRSLNFVINSDPDDPSLKIAVLELNPDKS